MPFTLVLKVVVDHDAALVVDLDASVLQPEPFGVGDAPDGNENHIRLKRLQGAIAVARLDLHLQRPSPI